MTPLIEVKHLSKQFNKIKAVDDLSFTVGKGSIFGFLGQNGAGKSTTLRMLLTLVRPTAGSIRIFEKDLFANRHQVLQQTGALIEKPDHYLYLTAYQNLSIMARLSGCHLTRQQLMQQLEQVKLAERAHTRVRTFSQGMKQRLGIACALVHNPTLLVLDEPTNGLDPQGIADMRHLILHLSQNENKTILISSHLLSEVEQMADFMLIIDKGKKVTEGRVADLLNPQHTIVELRTTNNENARKLLQESSWSQYLRPSDENLFLHLHQKLVPELNRYLVEQHIEVLSLQSKHSLEKYFLSLTGEE